MRSATLVVVCLVALAAAASGTAAGDSGVVASVTDGDTLRLTDGRRVRLVQVDTPELGGGECYSRAARTQLLQLAGPGTRVRARRPIRASTGWTGTAGCSRTSRSGART